MDDRIPTPGLEGRVKITKEDGTSFLAFLEMADNPSNPGTPISKATLLKDATAAKFGLGADAVPDDVFSMLSRFHAGLGNEYLWEKLDTENQLVGYVNSPDPNAYPPAVDDGFAYNRLGQLGGFAKIETGSYIGTGTFNINAPCRLTFELEPKIVFIYSKNFEYVGILLKCNYSKLLTNTGVNSLIGGITDKTASWYSRSNADSQLNASGITFDYFAIG